MFHFCVIRSLGDNDPVAVPEFNCCNIPITLIDFADWSYL